MRPQGKYVKQLERMSLILYCKMISFLTSCINKVIIRLVVQELLSNIKTPPPKKNPTVTDFRRVKDDNSKAGRAHSRFWIKLGRFFACVARN